MIANIIKTAKHNSQRNAGCFLHMVKVFGHLGIPLIDGKICLNLYNPARYKTSKKNAINAKKIRLKIEQIK